MPELPEVETTRRGIAPNLIQHKIVRVLVRMPNLRWPVPAELTQLLTGKTVNRVTRRAKYILLWVDGGSVLIHLGMSGSLGLVQADLTPGKHDHVDFFLDSGILLRFTDPRRFGSILWLASDPFEHPLLANLGPEPLSDSFDGEYLHRRSRGRKVAVKMLLMNNRLVAGIGNIYASEALFVAGIRPDRAAGRISRTRYETLSACIKEVLNRAIEMGGTTLRDFLNADGRPGYFKQTLMVYGRADQPCTKCRKLLKQIRLGQRSSVFCSSCQR
jgi:formamidopyrimidine-DNA glycosylase|tara:strand:+ start:12289 stop:13104 length:816 start_codon:yes stop_codon:yes gene_type:complete